MRCPLIKNLSRVLIIALAIDAGWIVASWLVPFYSLPAWFCWFTGFLVGGGVLIYAKIILWLIKCLVVRIKFKMIVRKLIKEVNKGKK